MNRYIFILISLLFASCQSDPELFDEVNKMAEFDKVFNPTLIQYGKESGFIEPMMEYGIFEIDTVAFRSLQNSIQTSERFTEGKYYLNIELDDYIQKNNLEILNISKSSISENHYDKTYYLYLLSDRKTFSICKVNH